MSEPMKTLSRDEILAASDLPRVPVDVPEWGGRVFVRALTVGEQDALFADARAQDDAEKGYNARLVAFCTVDENGGRLFVDADYAALEQKSAVALGRLIVAIGKVNAATPAAREEIAGN
jgi:hypothetical protein